MRGWKIFKWMQIGGDVDPGEHGGTIARCDGYTLDLIEIQPTVACIGERDAVALGFPFWSKTASFALDDLRVDRDVVRSALECSGITASEIPLHRAPLVIAEALLSYGISEAGPGGWAKDILPSERVNWWVSELPRGPRFLYEAERDFRTLVRENR